MIISAILAFFLLFFWCILKWTSPLNPCSYMYIILYTVHWNTLKLAANVRTFIKKNKIMVKAWKVMLAHHIWTLILVFVSVIGSGSSYLHNLLQYMCVGEPHEACVKHVTYHPKIKRKEKWFYLNPELPFLICSKTNLVHVTVWKILSNVFVLPTTLHIKQKKLKMHKKVTGFYVKGLH